MEDQEKKANYSVQRLLKNIGLMNDAPFKRPLKWMVINVLGVWVYNHKKEIKRTLKNSPLSFCLPCMRLVCYLGEITDCANNDFGLKFSRPEVTSSDPYSVKWLSLLSLLLLLP